MRPIHEAKVDTIRPVLVLTRELVRPDMSRVTVAPITTTIRGLSTEVTVGRAIGLERNSVINCDAVTTIPVSARGAGIGYFFSAQEESLSEALRGSLRSRMTTTTTAGADYGAEEGRAARPVRSRRARNGSS